MNIQHNNIEETLWNYIDGTLEEKQIVFVEELLKSNAEWKTCYAGLMEVHQLMQDNATLDQPSMRFTQNVMEEISRLYITPATNNYINKNVIRGIGLFFLITIGGLLIYSLSQADWSRPSSGSIPTINLPQVDWRNIFNSAYMNVFMMANIILALMLLDMFLLKRKKIKLKH